jgi:redox-sensitive bicupin YhaK (pirin superfamily)
MSERQLQRIVQAQSASDGDGVKIKRIAGSDINPVFDPFLLLDEIKSDEAADYVGGFPAHPHRGFETITYMIDGRLRHEDHLGNRGLLTDGGVQWMLAGRGVIHSEMPEQTEGRLHGFQLWLNLPAAEKMQLARYQDFQREELPLISLDNGGQVKVIAGRQGEVVSPMPVATTAPLYLDIQLPAGASYSPLLAGYAAVALYVYQGQAGQLKQSQMGFYGEGEQFTVTAGEHGVRLLLLAGRAIGEPIAQHGPFVMNSVEEIKQAINDYSAGRLAEA